MKRTVKRLKSTKAASEDLKPLLSLDLSLPEATRRFQAAYIKKQLARARGNMTDAAERLGLHRANLYRKMHQLSHDPERATKTGAPRKKAASLESRAKVDEAGNEKEGNQDDGQEENTCRESGWQATVTHRAKLRGVTMVIKSSIADPDVLKRFFRYRVAAPAEWVVTIWANGLRSERSKARSHRRRHRSVCPHVRSSPPE